MLATAELKRYWLQTVQEAVDYRGGLPARVADVEYAAMRARCNPGRPAIYRRMEKLVQLGYLDKQKQKGYHNTYTLTDRGKEKIR